MSQELATLFNRLHLPDPMLRNYFLTAFRHMRRNTVFAAVNVLGLAVAMATALLIFLWISDEMSFDRFHSNAERIVRVERDYGWTIPNMATPFPARDGILESVSGVDNAVRLAQSNHLVSNGVDSWFETGIVYADDSVLEVFSFEENVSGPDRAEGAIITRSTARKYFGQETAVGRSLMIGKQFSVEVSMVIEDNPENSTIQFDMLLPIRLVENTTSFSDSWASNWLTTYLLLSPGADLNVVSSQIKRVLVSNNESDANRLQDVVLRPLTQIHLFESGTNSIFTFGLLGVFLIVLAAVNFTNMATSAASTRALEIGLRKVVGARRGHLVIQFLGESVLTSGIGGMIALLLASAALPWFRQLTGKSMNPGELFDPFVIASLAGIVLITGLLSGLYPSLMLSSARTTGSLKHAVSSGGIGLRRSLVGFQFIVSCTLLVGMAVMVNQVDYLRTKNPGYSRDQLLYIRLVTEEARSVFPALKEEWSTNPAVSSVSGSEVLPVNMGWNSNANWEGKVSEEPLLVNHNRVASGYPETMGLAIVEGRSFDETRPGDLARDGSGNFLINETASKAMGGSLVGKRMSLGGVEGTVVGVVQDFHIQSLKQPIRPFALMLVPGNVRFALVQIRNNWSSEVIASLESDWKGVLPDHPFEFKFFDEAIEDMYTSEIRLSVLIRIFAGIAVVIGCIGLFGLTSFSARTRRKEFAVRRVVGATQFQIIRLVGKELILLFALASAISVPLAWTLAERWLESFPFRVEPGWMPTLASIALLAATALATVLYQAIKSAGENPVLALKE